MTGDITINYVAVLAAAVANMVVGFLWYGPVFGKIWMKLMGFTPEKMEEMKKKPMGKSYAIMFASSLVMAYVLAHFVAVWNVTDIWGAVQLAFWIWLGFIATVVVSTVLWEGKSWQLYFLNIAYYLVSLSAMTLILVAWK